MARQQKPQPEAKEAATQEPIAAPAIAQPDVVQEPIKTQEPVEQQELIEQSTPVAEEVAQEPIRQVLEDAAEEVPQEPTGPTARDIGQKLISITNDRADHFKEGRIMNKEEIATLEALRQVYITLRSYP